MKSIQKIRHKYIRKNTTSNRKIAHSLKSHKYDERCKILNITNLTERRIRGDLIKNFKIEKNLDELNWTFLPLTGIARANRTYS